MLELDDPLEVLLVLRNRAIIARLGWSDAPWDDLVNLAWTFDGFDPAELND